MNASRRKDNKAEGRRTTPAAKAKEAPERLSDLVREEGKSSEETAVNRPGPRLRPGDRTGAGTPATTKPDIAPEDGRREKTRIPPKEAPVEQAVPQPQGAAERPHHKHLDPAHHVFQRAVDTMRGIVHAVRAHAPFSIYSAEEAAERLLQNLEVSDSLLVHVFTDEGPPVDPAREAVNVCILAVKLGLELGYDKEELNRLSLAALLHDIGMARLPQDLIEKNGPLSPVERASLGHHPEEGAKVIRGLGPEYTWLIEIIFQAHERVDGSGYPKALKGADVHDHAQVIGLADVYESLVHHRPHRPRRSPLDALKEILNRERAAFPDKILKALIQALSPYPVGSLVRLNTGEIGRVVAINDDRPLRPIVEVLVRGGKRLEKPMVSDLSQSPLLNIQDSLLEETLT